MESDALRAARERKRLQTDFPYFCEKYIKIQTKRDGIQPLKLRKYQLRLWKMIKETQDNNLPVRILILKSRQLGFSTMMQAYMFWKTIMAPNSGCLTVAQDTDTSAELFSKIEFAFENLPDFLRSPLEQARDTSKRGKQLAFGRPLNSKFHVRTSGAKNLGRGFTFQRMHLSEFAFWDGAENKLYGLMQALGKHPGTECFIETTANGLSTHHHKLWKRAGEGESTWQQFFVGWNEDPDCHLTAPKHFHPKQEERQLKKRYGLTNDQIYWRRVTIEDECDGDEEKFRQEYPLNDIEAFIASGNPYIGPEALKGIELGVKKPMAWGKIELIDGQPKIIGGCTDEYNPGEGFINQGYDPDKAWWWIWKKPIPGIPYAIGADIAGGTSKDFSAAHVMNMMSGEVVATFRGKLDPDEFAYQLRWMGLTYNVAMIAPEKNGEGRATVLKLQKDLAYPRLFYHNYEDEWGGGVRHVWGWLTSQRTRPTMLPQLAAAFRERSIYCPCERTLRDLLALRRVDGQRIAQAADGSNDDMVFSLAIVNSSEVRALASYFVDMSEFSNLGD